MLPLLSAWGLFFSRCRARTTPRHLRFPLNRWSESSKVTNETEPNSFFSLLRLPNQTVFCMKSTQMAPRRARHVDPATPSADGDGWSTRCHLIARAQSRRYTYPTTRAPISDKNKTKDKKDVRSMAQASSATTQKRPSESSRNARLAVLVVASRDEKEPVRFRAAAVQSFHGRRTRRKSGATNSCAARAPARLSEEVAAYVER